MYQKLEGGTIVNVQGLECCLPPEGYIYNIITKKLEYRGVFERSPIKSEQYWEVPPFPSWYKEVMKAWDDYDKKRKDDDDEEFYDARLEDFKSQEWDRRLNGYWYRNNGDAVYLTGTHYLYMRWWFIDVGLPKFRIPDLEKAYFMQYCIEDSLSMGMVEVTKRRFGKSFWAGLFVTEYITRTKMTNGGIQSKTGLDSKKFFAKTVVNPFRRLPKFFRPEYDMSLGVNPKTEMRFQKTNVRGKKAQDNIAKDELGSIIDHQSADAVAYDGQKLHRYVGDEVGKCFAKGTKIRMWDGSEKNVEDIDNGEFVMGDDSSARLVYGKTKGTEKLYSIVLNKGEGFTCNESHILSLSVSDRVYINDKKYLCGDIVNISVKEFLTFDERKRKNFTIYRTGYELPEVEHKVSPYMLGVWLGDGRAIDFSITNVDKEVIDCVYDFAKEHSLSVRIKEDNISYHVTSHKVGVNHISKELRRLKLLSNKHIPDEYLNDSESNRLSLLAGLIDTDGYVSIRKGFTALVEITQKNKALATDIQTLALSVGFYASFTPKIAVMKRLDGSIYRCMVYKVQIYGQLDRIPTKIMRKQIIISTHKNRRNPLKSGFQIKEVGIGEYFGFAVNGNHLFLLANGIVVHNTTEVNVYDRYEVVRYCMKDDEGKIIGKALLTTTVEKIDSDKDGVQDAFKLLWNESNQNNRRENGTTASGLYRFFMSARRTRYFDKYGYPDEIRTEREILSDREGVKHNPRSLFARIRKEPLTIEEAFSIDADTCIFNAFNIGARQRELEEKPVFKRPIWFYRNENTGLVSWRDVTEKERLFHWKITDSFIEDKDSNKFEMQGSLKKPANKDKCVIGIDGYSNSQGGKKWGSQASAWMGYKVGSGKPKKVFGHLYGRPIEKDTLHEQVMLAAEFLGCEAGYEHNSDDFFSFFKRHGNLLYLALYPKILIEPIKLEATERHRGVPTTPYSLTKQADLGVSYFECNSDLIDFETLLDDAPTFDPDDRTKSDITVSFLIWNAMASETTETFKPPKEPLIKIYGQKNSRQTNPAMADY